MNIKNRLKKIEQHDNNTRNGARFAQMSDAELLEIAGQNERMSAAMETLPESDLIAITKGNLSQVSTESLIKLHKAGQNLPY